MPYLIIGHSLRLNSRYRCNMFSTYFNLVCIISIYHYVNYNEYTLILKKYGAYSNRFSLFGCAFVHVADNFWMITHKLLKLGLSYLTCYCRYSRVWTNVFIGDLDFLRSKISSWTFSFEMTW